jgi:hypothetical protein
MIIGFAMLVGVAAFAWAGFLGNPDDKKATVFSIFIREPWLLFLWLCFLMVIVELTILQTTYQDRMAARAARREIFAVTFISILAVVLIRLISHNDASLKVARGFFDEIGGVLRQNLPWTLFLLNLLLILVYWVGLWGARLWRAWQGQRNNEISGEQFAGDFIIGIVLSMLVAPLFSAVILQSIMHDNAVGPCDALWLPPAIDSHCDPSAGSLQASTLFFFDLIIQPCLYLGAALGVVLFTSVVKAVNRGSLLEFVGTFPEVIKEVGKRLTWPVLAMQLRIFWPIGIFGAVAAAALSSVFIQEYLYNMYVLWHGCNVAPVDPSKCGVPFNQNGTIIWLDTDWSNYGRRLEGLGAATGALVAAIISVTLRVYSPQLTAPSDWQGQARKEITFLGGVFVLSYWMFSLILSIGNQVGIWVINAKFGSGSPDAPVWLWAPFIQPDPIAVLSLLIFLVFLNLRWWRNRKTRGGAGNQPHPAF